MILLRAPTATQIDAFLAQQQAQGLSYTEVGATAIRPPEKYVVDHTRVKLGHGEDVFQAGVKALQNWEQFRFGWLVAEPRITPLEVGQSIAIIAKMFGLYWMNACRIVYTVPETQVSGSNQQTVIIKQFGFAYGTFDDHVGTGEERFLLEMDEQGAVYYDVMAFSRPHSRLARVGYPVMRRIQKSFGQRSAQRMLEVVKKQADVEA